jgi:monovalent cation/proton antiporter MnhG/PhaG subunit
MTTWLAGCFLVLGSAICLIAAAGVLRMPDVFTRMHAATKAGVAGCGLVLVGVAFLNAGVEVSGKIAAAVVFLLLTTPIAGHLLGRAAYVGGVALWSGTIEDHLERELRRGAFDLDVDRSREVPATALAGALAAPREASRRSSRRTVTTARSSIDRVIVALACCPDPSRVIDRALGIALRHDVRAVGLALVDVPLLENVGSVPVGANYYAGKLREHRIARARAAVADLVQLFGERAVAMGVKYAIKVEEGRPERIVSGLLGPRDLLVLAPHRWFDQDILATGIDGAARLLGSGIRPVVTIDVDAPAVRRLLFVHDGSERSLATWRWLVDLDPWPDASIAIAPGNGAGNGFLAGALDHAARRGRIVATHAAPDPVGMRYDAVAIGNGGHGRGVERFRPSSWKRARHPAPTLILG